jgi:hypothetical protein
MGRSLETQFEYVVLIFSDECKPMFAFLPVWAIKSYFIYYFAMARYNIMNVRFGQFGFALKTMFTNLVYAYRSIGLQYKHGYGKAYSDWTGLPQGAFV